MASEVIGYAGANCSGGCSTCGAFFFLTRPPRLNGLHISQPPCYIRTSEPPQNAEESFWNCLPTDTSSCATEALVSSRMPSSMVSAQCPRVYGTRGWYQSAMIGGFSGGWWLESISPSVSGRWWHAHTPTPLVTPAQWSAALLVSPAWLFASPSLLQ